MSAQLLTLLLKKRSRIFLLDYSVLVLDCLSSSSGTEGGTHPGCDFINRVSFFMLFRVCNGVKSSQFASFPLRYHPE